MGVLAEAMLSFWARYLGKDVCAFRTGSTPRGWIDPEAMRSKSVALT